MDNVAPEPTHAPANLYRGDRVLFLDIDGVLNSNNWVREEWQRRLERTGLPKPITKAVDPVAVELLNTLVEHTQCCIVISSAWRNYNSLDNIKAVLVGTGFKHPDSVVGVTPRLKYNGAEVGADACIRGREIRAWLNQCSDPQPLYVIVDDSSDMLPEQSIRFVRTRLLFGMTVSDACRCLHGLLADKLPTTRKDVADASKLFREEAILRTQAVRDARDCAHGTALSTKMNPNTQIQVDQIK